MSRKLVAIQLLWLISACGSGGFASQSELVFTLQPSTSMAGVAIGPVAVTVQDGHGNVVTSANASITLAIGTNAAAGTLSGTTIVPTVSGVATFSNLSLDKPGSGYTLTASAPGLAGTTSISFDVTPAPPAPTKLGFSAQPSTTSVGQAIQPPVQVLVLDQYGNVFTSASATITLAIGTNAAAGTLSGTTIMPTVSGVATFSDLSLDKPGSGYTLTASAPGLAGTTSIPFDVTPAPPAPTKLGFSAQPSTTLVGHAIQPPVQVVVLDASGHLVTTPSVSVTLAIQVLTGLGGNLSGTLTVATAAGVATFSDLSIDTHGNYTLVASATGLAWASTDLFAITSVPLVFSSVSAGLTHTCGVAQGGAAYCWGSDQYGQLGANPDVVIAAANSMGPVAVVPYYGLGPYIFAEVSANAFHTCGLTTAGKAYSWGYGHDGAGGFGPYPHPIGPAYVDSPPYTPLILAAVSAGGYDYNPTWGGGSYTCGLTSAGAAYCWGSNTVGELGDGSNIEKMFAAAVAGGLAFAALSAGTGLPWPGAHTCGVATAGIAYCWGDNTWGQLGDGTTTGKTSPVAVLGGLTFAAVSAGGEHTCGVTSAGAAYCWGDNSFGQLGDGTTTGRTSPTAVQGGLTFATVSAGDAHTCGLTTAGAAYCWGDNSSGQLGDGTTTGRTSPTAVQGGLALVGVSAGSAHTCAITSAGVVYCWGNNSPWGQLGDGTTTDSLAPVKVAGQP